MVERFIWFGILTAVVQLLSSFELNAKQRVTGQYATSQSPYWAVGNVSKELSIACREGNFRQRKYLYYSIGYLGKKGRGITGIAKKGWNLFDPMGLARSEYTYHFFNQGYSNCKVFVAKTPQK